MSCQTRVDEWTTLYPHLFTPFEPTPSHGTGLVEPGDGLSALVRPDRCRHAAGHLAGP